MYEIGSDEYNTVSEQVLTLLRYGVEHGTSTLDPNLLDIMKVKVEDAATAYKQKVQELKDVHFSSTSSDSNTPEFQLDKLLSPNTYEQFQSIEDYLEKKGES